MRYFVFVVAGFGSACVAYTAIFFASLGRGDSQNSAAIASWYEYKHRVADTMGPPRIIVVGGSGGLYGIQAAMIEEMTGIPTVNFATHAGLGLPYLLHEAQQVLQPGDTAILAFEYELYFPAEINAVLSDYILSADPAYLWELPLRERIQFIASASIPAMFERILTPVSARETMFDLMRRQQSGELNDRGDFIANAKADQPDGARETVEAQRPLGTLMSTGWNAPNAAWEQLSGFVTWCRENEIRVFATYPNTIDFAEYESGRMKQAERQIRKRFREMGVVTLGDARSAMLPAEDFFNTIYHPTFEGAERRTARLLESLKPKLESPDRAD